MLSISLARRGKKKKPYYHIILRNKTSKRDSGKELGFFNPLLEANHPNSTNIKLELYNYWCGVGAQPTLRVKNIVRSYLKRQAEATTTTN